MKGTFQSVAKLRMGIVIMFTYERERRLSRGFLDKAFVREEVAKRYFPMAMTCCSQTVAVSLHGLVP